MVVALFIFIFNLYYFCRITVTDYGIYGRNNGAHLYDSEFSKINRKKWLNIIGWNGNLAVLFYSAFIVLSVAGLLYILGMCFTIIIC